jgi:hypothetical protein
MFKQFRRPSPALIISIIALFAAIGGVATALPGKNSVDSGDIKKNGVKSSDIKNNNVRGVDVKELTLGEVPSATLAGGPTAYGQIDDPNVASPGVIEANSRGVTDANVTRPSAGIFCFIGLPGVKSVTAIADAATSGGDEIVRAATIGDPNADCPAGTNVVVYTHDISSGIDSAGFIFQLWS